MQNNNNVIELTLIETRDITNTSKLQSSFSIEIREKVLIMLSQRNIIIKIYTHR